MPEERHDNSIPMHCLSCDHRWIEHFELPMIVEAFVARANSILCPVCAARKIYLGSEKKEEVKDVPHKP